MVKIVVKIIILITQPKIANTKTQHLPCIINVFFNRVFNRVVKTCFFIMFHEIAKQILNAWLKPNLSSWVVQKLGIQIC